VTPERKLELRELARSYMSLGGDYSMPLSPEEVLALIADSPEENAIPEQYATGCDETCEYAAAAGFSSVQALLNELRARTEECAQLKAGGSKKKILAEVDIRLTGTWCDGACPYLCIYDPPDYFRRSCALFLNAEGKATSLEMNSFGSHLRCTQCRNATEE